jgi:hypothetical protein
MHRKIFLHLHLTENSGQLAAKRLYTTRSAKPLSKLEEQLSPHMTASWFSPELTYKQLALKYFCQPLPIFSRGEVPSVLLRMVRGSP